MTAVGSTCHPFNWRLKIRAYSHSVEARLRLWPGGSWVEDGSGGSLTVLYGMCINIDKLYRHIKVPPWLESLPRWTCVRRKERPAVRSYAKLWDVFLNKRQ